MFRPSTGNNLTPANPAVYDHGITQGASEALDAQTLWIFAAVRALNQPQPGNLAAGAAVFAANCASCHGGAKWTKSEIFHRDNPAAVAQNGAPLDPGVTRLPATLDIPGSTGERVLLVHLQQPHHQISREGGDVRCQQSAGDPRQRRRQHGVWGEWLQRAVVAQYQLSRAVPASRPSPDPRGGLRAARVGARWAGVSAD